MKKMMIALPVAVAESSAGREWAVRGAASSPTAGGPLTAGPGAAPGGTGSGVGPGVPGFVAPSPLLARRRVKLRVMAATSFTVSSVRASPVSGGPLGGLSTCWVHRDLQGRRHVTVS